jgi:hypothetical protein
MTAALAGLDVSSSMYLRPFEPHTGSFSVHSC